MSSFWMETNKATVLKRNRKSITIPAFAVRCGETNGSWEFGPATGTPGFFLAGYTTDASTKFNTAVTLEGWARTYNLYSSVVTDLLRLRDIITGVVKFALQATNGFFRIEYTTAGPSTTVTSTTVSIPQGEWFHFALTYDSTNIKLYINGELVHTTAFVTALITTTEHGTWIGRNWRGNMAEARFWTVALTKEQIQVAMNWRRGDNAGLEMYYRANSAVEVVDFLDATKTFAYNPTFGDFTDELYPTLIDGASFVAARWTIAGDRKVSLKYPVEKPDGVNFQLVVCFVDEDDNVFRYKLWDMEGVTINPPLQRYRGETITETFYIEAWNIDGASHATMEEALTIYVSKATIPTNQRDETSLEHVDEPTTDISLGEPFPLVFPVDWNTEIWGTVAAPVTKPVGTYSTNLAVYGAIQ